MDEVTKTILSDVYTGDQLIGRLEEVEEASRWVYKGGQSPLSEKILNVSDPFINILRQLEANNKLPTARKDLSSKLKKVAKEIDSIDPVKMTLAFAPSSELLKKIEEKFLADKSGKAILDITVDPQIIGGCIIEYGGEYRDYSLVKQLEGAIEQAVKKVI